MGNEDRGARPAVPAMLGHPEPVGRRLVAIDKSDIGPLRALDNVATYGVALQPGIDLDLNEDEWVAVEA